MGESTLGILDRIVQKERADWHFDPLAEESDYHHVGNIKQKLGNDWNALVRFAAALDKVVAEVTISDASLARGGNAEIAWNAELATAAGYDKSNTGQFKAYSDKYPDVFAPILNLSDLVQPIGGLLYQKPGAIIPWHYDTFAFYAKKFGIEDRTSIRLTGCGTSAPMPGCGQN